MDELLTKRKKDIRIKQQVRKELDSTVGKGFGLVCKKCHYSYEVNLGIGYNFPQIYQKTMEAAKKGILGESVQSFLITHPDGALDCNAVLLQCTSCGELDSDMDLSMYIPQDRPVSHINGWSISNQAANTFYALPRELKEHYQLMKTYNHNCRKCGNRMRIIKEEELIPKDQKTRKRSMTINVNCPKCHQPMMIGGYMMWD